MLATSEIRTFLASCFQVALLIVYCLALLVIGVESLYLLSHLVQGGPSAAYGWLLHVTPTRAEWPGGASPLEMLGYHGLVVLATVTVVLVKRRLHLRFRDVFR